MCLGHSGDVTLVEDAERNVAVNFMVYSMYGGLSYFHLVVNVVFEVYDYVVVGVNYSYDNLLVVIKDFINDDDFSPIINIIDVVGITIDVVRPIYDSFTEID